MKRIYTIDRILKKYIYIYILIRYIKKNIYLLDFEYFIRNFFLKLYKVYDWDLLLKIIFFYIIYFTKFRIKVYRNKSLKSFYLNFIFKILSYIAIWLNLISLEFFMKISKKW